MYNDKDEYIFIQIKGSYIIVVFIRPQKLNIFGRILVSRWFRRRRRRPKTFGFLHYNFSISE